MTPNSAYSMEQIVEGVDYTPADTTESVGGVSVINGKQPPIYALFCTTSNTGPVDIQALDGTTVTVPTGAFVKGVVYYIYLKKLVAAGGVTFIGFRYNNHPLVY